MLIEFNNKNSILEGKSPLNEEFDLKFSFINYKKMTMIKYCCSLTDKKVLD